MPTGIYIRTEETKRKIGLAKKGKKFSEERKIKHSIALTGRRYKLKNKKILSFSHKKRLSEVAKIKNIIRKGKECNFWKGGISFEKYTIDWKESLRESIRKRDNYTCYICGNIQDKQKHSVHHIDYDKKNCNSNNLITLCRKCHCKTNHNRRMWRSFFGLSKYIIKKYFTVH
jgi:5-methylcytosine-specific restriction endonuclease McrA